MSWVMRDIVSAESAKVLLNTTTITATRRQAPRAHATILQQGSEGIGRPNHIFDIRQIRMKTSAMMFLTGRSAKDPTRLHAMLSWTTASKQTTTLTTSNLDMGFARMCWFTSPKWTFCIGDNCNPLFLPTKELQQHGCPRSPPVHPSRWLRRATRRNEGIARFAGDPGSFVVAWLGWATCLLSNVLNLRKAC